MRRRVASPHVSGAGASVDLAARPAEPIAAAAGATTSRRRPSGRGRRRRWAIAVWIVVFGVLVWRRHALYGTIDFDLGIHDQSVWLLSRGHSFTTVRGLPVFGHHATFGYFLLVAVLLVRRRTPVPRPVPGDRARPRRGPDLPLGPRSAREPVGRSRPRAGVVAAARRAVVRVGDVPPRGHRDRARAVRLPRGGAKTDRLVLDLGGARDRLEGGPRPPVHRARAPLPAPETDTTRRGDDRGRRRCGSSRSRW